MNNGWKATAKIEKNTNCKRMCNFKNQEQQTNSYTAVEKTNQHKEKKSSDLGKQWKESWKTG